MQHKHIITEVFGNTIQGEGCWMGQPTIFIRYFGCTLRCPSFSLNVGEKNSELDSILSNLDKYKTLNELPLIKYGCDSYVSVYPECRRFQKEYTTDELETEILNIINNNIYSDYHICFTGGEPLLHQQSIIELIEKLTINKKFTKYTFETNGTVKLEKSFISRLNLLIHKHNIKITWSISPKLSNAGNNINKSIKPSSVVSYNLIDNSYTYLKFVIDDEYQITEIKEIINNYKNNGFIYDEIYLMPVGGIFCTKNQENEKKIVELCIKYGYRYSPRLHLPLFGNCWGK